MARLYFILFAVVFSAYFSFVVCHEHSHDHGHSHGNGHSHEPNGHSHDHHGHSHDHHGHAHDHGHSHEQHSHEEPSFKYSKTANIIQGGDHGKPTSKEEAPKVHKDSRLKLWLNAIGSTTLIGVAPVVILFFIPLDKSPKYQNFLRVLLGFASGGLLGDAFLHLIPHALSANGDHDHGSTHSHSHSHLEGEPHSHNMGVGLWILSGIVAFLAVDKLVRLLQGGSGHDHSHSVSKKEEQHGDNASKKVKEKTNGEAEKKDTKTNIGVSAYLNLVADFIHNFTDGMAIGASYLVSENVGMVTTFTIFLHEIPHEIGDFAILVQSGFSRKKAMMAQVATAIGALAGTVCSLLLINLANSWILPFTAGGFIYIATVSIIPELLGETKFGQSLKEIFAMLLGIFMMVLIVYIE